jgi:hypothetical protein
LKSADRGFKIPLPLSFVFILVCIPVLVIQVWSPDPWKWGLYVGCLIFMFGIPGFIVSMEKFFSKKTTPSKLQLFAE